mmetsp:Transcript_21674/g.71704  ORF Transcript_21674/g.71704 Transcript_21674/m.71704 type:complete len:201 (+) Transcript_21674:1105-1707(+)
MRSPRGSRRTPPGGQRQHGRSQPQTLRSSSSSRPPSLPTSSSSSPTAERPALLAASPSSSACGGSETATSLPLPWTAAGERRGSEGQCRAAAALEASGEPPCPIWRTRAQQDAAGLLLLLLLLLRATSPPSPAWRASRSRSRRSWCTTRSQGILLPPASRKSWSASSAPLPPAAPDPSPPARNLLPPRRCHGSLSLLQRG